MKLRTFIAVAAIVIFAACETTYRATDVSGVPVPDETQRAFSEQYPNAINIVWDNYNPDVIILNDWEFSGWPEMDAGDYVVRFDMDNEKYYAWYDSDGEWIGTAYVVSDYTRLPLDVHATLNKQFPAYSITSVNREFRNDRVVYEIVMKRNDVKVILLIDNEGNIIKQKTRSVY